MSGTTAVARVEATRLLADTRARVLAGVCLVGPVLFEVGLAAQQALPRDAPFGRYAHESGAAVSLVVLGFAGQWLLPVLVGVVAGEAISGEVAGGTWPLLVTRGVTRGQVVRGKALVCLGWAVLVVVLLAVSATLGVLATAGAHELVTLTGTVASPGHATLLVAEAWASSLLPAAGWTGVALLASSLTRRAGAGALATVVVGAVVQLSTLVPTVPLLQRVLLSAPTGAWHGLVSGPATTGPLWQGAVVSLAWGAGGTAAAAACVRIRSRS